MADRRDSYRQWYSSFDPKSMMLTLEGAGNDDEDLLIPARYEVCETCSGKGKHVNPSIDAGHGITQEEFDEDPDFRESYVRGDYDVQCVECKGQRVVPVMDETRATPEVQAAVERWMQDQADYAAECAAERRMGA